MPNKCKNLVMKKVIIQVFAFTCAAVLLCGCKGNKKEEKLSAYDVPKRTHSFSSDTATVSDSNDTEVSATNSTDVKEKPGTKSESKTTTVYDEVRADGEAEDMTPTPNNTSSEGGTHNDTSSEVKPSEPKDTSSVISSDESKSSDNSSNENKPSDNPSKDSMSGWSAWR